MAAKLWSVLSARMAMRLNSFSLQKVAPFVRLQVDSERLRAARMLRDDHLGAARVEVADDGI